MKRRLMVCQGGHCRRRLRRSGLAERASKLRELDVRLVGCQKVCRGPVVGTEIDGELVWFERMDSKKAWNALRDLMADGRIPKTLRKRRNAKRAGRLR